MTPGIIEAGSLAAAAKRAAPGAVTMIGGAHASLLPARTLEEFPAFDVAVAGEGEEKIVGVCRAAVEGRLADAALPGCAVRANGAVRDMTQEPIPFIALDTLPLPARELLDLRRYTSASTPGIPSGTRRATELFTSRGCPGRCIFCCSDKVFGRQVRFRGVDHVIQEIEDCKRRFGFNHFTIDDDTFTFNKNRALAFCERVARLGVTWDCDTRVDRIDAELMDAMAASGCIKIAFGVESGSQHILDLIQKGVTLEQIRGAFALARRARVMSCAFLVVGNHPEETREDLEQTWRFVRRLDPDLISVMIATPYPGTALHDIMRGEGLIGDVPWTAYAQSFTAETFSRTRTLSPQDLKHWQNELLKRFYLRPAYIARRLAALRHPDEWRYWFRAGIGFLGFLFGSKSKSEKK